MEDAQVRFQVLNFACLIPTNVNLSFSKPMISLFTEIFCSNLPEDLP